MDGSALKIPQSEIKSTLNVNEQIFVDIKRCIMSLAPPTGSGETIELESLKYLIFYQMRSPDQEEFEGKADLKTVKT